MEFDFYFFLFGVNGTVCCMVKQMGFWFFDVWMGTNSHFHCHCHYPLFDYCCDCVESMEFDFVWMECSIAYRGGEKRDFFFKKSFFVWMEIPITIDHSHNPLILIFAWIECSILFLAETNERICFLNVSPDEVIRSLFYNKNNDSLITVSVYASENFSSLKCRSTGIECVHSVAVHSNLPLWLIFTTYFAYVFIHFCS